MAYYHLPHPLDRPYQADVLEWILTSDKKYLILNAPTGFGKSPLAAATSLDFKTLVLVLHKSLQAANYRDQYQFSILYGKGSYPCKFPPEHFTKVPYSAADCDDEEAAYCECPYQMAKYQCSSSNRVCLNYAKYLYSREFAIRYEPTFLFLDEGHNLPNIITEFIGITLNYDNDFLQCNGGIQVEPGILQYPEAMTLFRICQRAIDHNKPDKEKDLKKWRKWQRLKLKTEIVNNILTNYELRDWFFESTNKALVIKPLTAKYHFKRLFGVADRVVIMSATVTPDLAERLGIEDEFDFMTVPSVWPVPTRLVYDLDAPAMNYRSTDQDKQKQANLILQILRSDKSGIIHTMSKYQAQELAERLTFGSDDLDFYIPGFGDTEEQLQDWYAIREPGTYCVSWAFQEGVDLGQEDINIVAKVPYASLGGNYNQIKKSYDPGWYLIQTAHRLEQAFGRHQRGIASHYTRDKKAYLADNAWHRLESHLSEDFKRRIRNYR